MILPMDETLVLCAIDLSGRPYFCFDHEFTTPHVGYMDTEMVREFFYAVSYSAAMNLHIKVLSGSNNHHIIEAMFKALQKLWMKRFHMSHAAWAVFYLLKAVCKTHITNIRRLAC